MIADPALRHKLITIDEILYARPQMPMASTRARGWGGITLDLHRPYFDCAESYPGLDHHLICYCPSGQSRLVQSRDGSVHDSVITPGISYIMPAGCPSSWEGDSGLSARLRVPTALIDAAAEQLGRRVLSRVELRNVFEVADPHLQHFALTMLAELEMAAHPAQLLLIDSISTALAAHLLRRYNAFELAERPQEIALSKRELARVTAFIEDNIDGTIRLEELAGLIRVSRFHFSRLFKRATGMSAISYVEQCRVRRAQMLIAETDLPLAEIALMAGFADQSHFTRRFHHNIGCTPAAFAREQGRRRSTRRSPANDLR